MELRNLRYFLTLAETESLRLASRRLDIGQASLARAIALLEADVAQRLFIRKPKSMVPTRAGRILMISAIRILAEADALQSRVDCGDLGECGQLRLGFTGSAWFNPFVPSAIQAYRGLKPDVTLHLSEGCSQFLLEEIEQGRLDAAFVRPVQVSPGLEFHHLLDEEMVLVLPPEHPMARRDRLTASDLCHEPFVMFARALNPTLYDNIINAFVQASVTLRIAQHVPQMQNLGSLVAAGVGMAVLPLSLARLQVGCHLRRDIDGLSIAIPLCIVVRGEDDRGMTADFLRFLKDWTWSDVGSPAVGGGLCDTLGGSRPSLAIRA